MSGKERYLEVKAWLPLSSGPETSERSVKPDLPLQKPYGEVGSLEVVDGGSALVEAMGRVGQGLVSLQAPGGGSGVALSANSDDVLSAASTA